MLTLLGKAGIVDDPGLDRTVPLRRSPGRTCYPHIPFDGANVTGFLLYEASITGKLLGMLKEIAPTLARVARPSAKAHDPREGTRILRAPLTMTIFSSN